MATTTPNYGWPVPTSTDYVKDGATAIEALGDAIDATVFGLGSAGLTLITSQSFTTSSAVNVNNCFSSTYTNYKVICNVTAATNETLVTLRMRVGGVDNSTASSYQRSYNRVINASVSGGTDLETSAMMVNVGTTVGGLGTSEIVNPFAAAPTRILNSFFGSSSASTANYFAVTSCNHTQAVSYDGFSLIPTAGTITGILKVYGYKN